MQKIAMIHPNLFERGGAERKLILMSKYLIDKGHTVDIIVRKYNKETTFKELIDEKLDIIEININKLKWFSEAFKILKQNNYDVVVAHNYPANIPVGLYKMFYKTKSIWVCNEVATLLHRRYSLSWKIYYKIEQYISSFFDIIIANSDFTAKSIKDYYKKEPKVIHSGVEIKEYLDLSKVDDKIKELVKEPYIFSLSRIEKHKNIEFLEKLANLSINILVAGRGSETKYLQELEEKRKNIIYVGTVNEDEKFFLYKNAKVFIFLPLAEPLGVTVMEALSQNTPVVAFNNGGPTETVLDKQNGFLANNSEEYLKNVKWILDNNFQIDDELGKNYILDKFSNERMIKDFYMIIKEGNNV